MEWPQLILDGWVVIRDLSWNAEVIAGVTGTTGGVTSWAGAVWLQRQRARVLPTLPSHHQAVKDGDDAGTRFFAAVHELTMSVTEAWNAVRARKGGGTVEESIRRDALRKHSDNVCAAADDLRADLSDYADLDRALDAPAVDLGQAWEYSNRHNYRTEYYTVTTTDSEGNTKTETRSRQVYVDTDHWFEFDKGRAQEARTKLRRWVEVFEQTTLSELGIHDKEVDLEQLDPAQRSFLERLVKHTVLEDADAEVDESDLKHWANQWLIGTNIDAHLRSFQSDTNTLSREWDELFRTMMQSRSHYHFKTRSRTHSGPAGYQSCNRLLNWIRSATQAWDAVDDMIGQCVHSAEMLVMYADDPETIEGDREYAQLAIAAYQSAFPDSELEVDQLVKYGWTTLGAGVFAVVAAGATWFLHPMGYSAF